MQILNYFLNKDEMRKSKLRSSQKCFCWEDAHFIETSATYVDLIK